MIQGGMSMRCIRITLSSATHRETIDPQRLLGRSLTRQSAARPEGHPPTITTLTTMRLKNLTPRITTLTIKMPTIGEAAVPKIMKGTPM